MNSALEANNVLEYVAAMPCKVQFIKDTSFILMHFDTEGFDPAQLEAETIIEIHASLFHF